MVSQTRITRNRVPLWLLPLFFVALLTALAVVVLFGFDIHPSDTNPSSTRFEWADAALGWFGLLFSIITFAVAFAISKKQDGVIRNIKEGITTRELGIFPHYLEDIIKLISEHEGRRICIAADYPGYGHYSAPEVFEKYRHALRQCFLKNESTLVVLKPSEWPSLQRKQFVNWDINTLKDSEKSKLATFLKKNTTSPADVKDFSGLSSLLIESNQQTMENAGWKKGKSNFRTVGSPLSIHMWIVADSNSGSSRPEMAIFAFPVYNANAIEYGFYTEDTKLISALKQTFDNIVSESAVYDP